MKSLLVIALLLCSAVAGRAQTVVPSNDPYAAEVGFPFRTTSILRPPAGAKVAIFEFEDMECPHCAMDYPVVRAAVAHYKLPFLRHDYPLTEIHTWSFEAAVTARYIQEQISPALGEQFRRDIFANQNRIANKDDLARYTRQWFDSHKQSFPFVLDASGTCRNEVKADRAFGDSLGIHGTPCLFVVTRKHWVLVTDINQLYQTIDMALAETSLPAPRRTARAQLP
jgi:protein-disulfide isomerase